MNTYAIAKSFISGGKVSISDARYLASDFLNKINRIAELEQKIFELQGGQTITLEAQKDYDRKSAHVRNLVRVNNRVTPTPPMMSELRDLLGFNVKISGWDFGTFLTGPQEHLLRFLKINDLVSQLIQWAYNEGFKDGRNLLFGLAEGTLSVKDFNEMGNK
jgi:hypothetical protein